MGSSSGMFLKLGLMVVVVMGIVVIAPYAEAATISCSEVANDVSACVSYLESGGSPSSSCCSGLKSLDSAASTTADRQAVCSCLKEFASSVSGINYSLAESLPSKCDISVPYAISPSTDCSTVK